MKKKEQHSERKINDIIIPKQKTKTKKIILSRIELNLNCTLKYTCLPVYKCMCVYVCVCVCKYVCVCVCVCGRPACATACS